jgi:hypothetical protein
MDKQECIKKLNDIRNNRYYGALNEKYPDTVKRDKRNFNKYVALVADDTRKAGFVKIAEEMEKEKF